MTVVRVLLVDDQAPFLRAMSSVVDETSGFEVVGEASSAEECIRSAAELLPDLVLMDVNLPGMDGVQATKGLRSCPSPPVVVLLSTYDEDAGAHFVAESGAAAYVTKSAFGPDRLRGVAPAILAVGGGSYSVLYVVAGVCALLGAVAILPVKRVR